MPIRSLPSFSLFLTAIAAAVFAAVTIAASPSTGLAAAPAAGAPIVATKQGRVRGMVHEGVREFLGIPYAAPPVGKLRWRAPEPHQSWSGVLNATEFGNQCAQVIPMVRRVVGSENCLYLNVYTPNPAPAGMPVMVWIHGGSFLIGSGAMYDGSKLAKKGKLVVVTINYRLGPLGFLASPSLDAENPNHVSGNYGLLDQLAALKWVKENIGAFGGNPDNVTVAGESAGGISVGLLMISPAAKGLFERAIMESGPFLHQRTLKQAEVQGEKLAEKLGCAKVKDVAACMRGKSTDEVLSAISASPIGPTVWGPAVDGEVLPGQPAARLAAGNFNKVPAINGSNHDEGTLFLAFAPPLTAARYEADVHKRLGANAAEWLAVYPVSSHESPSQAAAAAFGDAFFSCQVRGASELISKWAPVYEYEFNDENPPRGSWVPKSFPLGAFHGSEIQFVFATPPKGKEFSPAERKLSDEMMGYWIGFITSGDPGTHSPQWVRFKADDDKILSLAPGKIAYESDFAKAHHCALHLKVMRSMHAMQP